MILFSNYLTRLIKLFKQVIAFIKRWIRTKLDDVLKHALNNSIERLKRSHASRYWRLKHLILKTLYILLRASFDMYESTL